LPACSRFGSVFVAGEFPGMAFAATGLYLRGQEVAEIPARLAGKCPRNFSAASKGKADVAEKLERLTVGQQSRCRWLPYALIAGPMRMGGRICRRPTAPWLKIVRPVQTLATFNR
jgi:hypothetical protein